LPAGFQAEVAPFSKSMRPAKYLPDQENPIRIRSGDDCRLRAFRSDVNYSMTMRGAGLLAVPEATAVHTSRAISV
jgi:hypothetical protein